MATIELNKENFGPTIQDNAMVVIDFWAPWCGPCRAFAPTFETASEKHPDVVFAKVNTEVEQEIAAAFNIRSIPTLIVFREQVILFAQPGALAPAQFEQLLAQTKAVDMAEVLRELAAEEKGGSTAS